MSNSLEAARVSQASLPVIDISGLSSSRLADREAVGARLRTACLDNGFFYISNHGVPEDRVADLFAEAARVLRASTRAKGGGRQVPVQGQSRLRALQGQTLEPGAPPDLKEGYYIGPNTPRLIRG